MFEQLKNLLSQKLAAANEVWDSYTNPKKNYQVKPTEQARLNNLLSTALKSESPWYKKEAAKALEDRYTAHPNGVAFQNPFQKEMRKADENHPSIQRVKLNIGSGIDWTKRILNGAADFTYRGFITRPVAQAAMTGADIATNLLHKVDPRMPEHMPSVTATDPAGRFLFGDQPMNSYTGQARTGTNWLEGVGVPKNAAVPLGIAAGTISAGLDSTGVGGLGKSAAKETAEKAVVNNFDTIAEAAWKAKGSKGRLSALMNYGDELLSRGFKREEIDKLGAKVGSWILDNNITPKQWAEKTAAKASEFAHLNSFVDKFKDFVGGRQSASWQGLIKSQEFKKLDQMPLDQLAPAIESGKLDIAPLRQYFDDALKRLNDAGIKTNKVENYLPHLYNASADQVEATIGRKLSRGSKFSLSRYFQDYAEAKSYGLTAKYSKISDVIKEYESSITKSIEDKKMFDYLRDNKFFMTKSEINKLPKEKRLLTKGWQAVDPKAVGGEFKTDTVFYASDEVRTALERFLQDNTGNRVNQALEWLNSGASFNNRVKSITLTGGIPGKAINKWATIMHKRFVMSSNTPIVDAVKGYKWMWNTDSAEAFVRQSLPDAADAVKHGLTLDNADFKAYVHEALQNKEFLAAARNKIGNLNEWVDELFATPTFKQLVPAMKLYRYKSDVKILMDAGLDSKLAKQTAAEAVNEMMTGKNYDYLMKDKSMQAFWRTLTLAPSYYESTIDVAKGMGKSLLNPKDPKSILYKTYVKNSVLYRLLREFTNLAVSGHFMFQNDVGHKNEIETPYWDGKGKRVYITSSGADMENMPIDMADYALHGNFGAAANKVLSKKSPLLDIAFGIGGGVDYKGDKIANDWDSNPVKAGKYAAWGSGYVLPPQIREVANMALGKQGLAETTNKVLELPLKFSGGAQTKTEKEQLDFMKQGGMSNSEIGQTLDANKPWNQDAQLTEEQQLRNIREGLPVNQERNWLGKPKNTPSTYGGSLATQNGAKTTQTPGSYNLRNEFKSQAAIDEKKALVKKIYNAGLETDEQLNRALQANGIDPTEAEYLMASELGVENGKRSEYVMSKFGDAKSEEDVQTMALELAKNGILTTGVTADLLKRGKIGPESKKMLDNIIKLSKGEKISSGSSSKSIPASAKLNLPTAQSLPALKAPTLKVSSSSSGTIKAPKMRESAKLPTMADMKAAMAIVQGKNNFKFSALPK